MAALIDMRPLDLNRYFNPTNSMEKREQGEAPNGSLPSE